jgi:hypothetical protein
MKQVNINIQYGTLGQNDLSTPKSFGARTAGAPRSVSRLTGASSGMPTTSYRSSRVEAVVGSMGTGPYVCGAIGTKPRPWPNVGPRLGKTRNVRY